MVERRRGPGSQSTDPPGPGAASGQDAGRDREERLPATRWVNVARACEVLGVNESTVRRWADAGQIRCFRTPGGHRRFSERELLDLVEGGSSGRRRDLKEAAVSRIRRELSSGHRDAGWYEEMATDERETLRPLGRRLVELVDDDIARRAPHPEIEREVDAIGERYGQVLFERGMPLSQAIEAFTFFRRSLDEAAKRLAERQRMGAFEAARAREQIAQLADRVLRGVSAAYDDARVAPSRRPRGGAADEPAGAAREPVSSHAIFLELRGRRVLLVGGGRAAAEHVGTLWDAGADVTILAPEIDETLGSHVREGRARWTPRAFAPGDRAGFDVVMVVDDGAVDAGVAVEVRSLGIWVNAGGVAADDPAAVREER